MKKLSKILILSLAFVLLFGVVYSSAYVAYDTYTYSISGKQMLSPTAYSTNNAITSVDMGLLNKDKFANPIALNGASDIVTDDLGNVYIADVGNNRIVVLNKYYKVTNIIDSYYDDAGQEVKFNKPNGLFITDASKTADGSSYIYVCDTENKSIVVFDREYNYVRTITPSPSPLLDVTRFKPVAVAVDIYGRIFVVADQTEEGVIVLSNAGEFTGYIGAQKVSYSIIDIIWRKFQSKEQLAQQSRNIPSVYNNLTVDDDGFVYATSDKVNESEQFKAIKSKASDYSPVKKLNSTGHEIMKRNGFFDPGGEVDVFYAKDVSKISDVALGPEGMWTILDYKRSKLFTYDQQGNLLFAFGDGGEYGQGGELLGNGENLQSIAYQSIDGTSYLLVLNRTHTVFKPQMAHKDLKQSAYLLSLLR